MKTVVIFITYVLHGMTAGDHRVITYCTGSVKDYYWREYRGIIPHDAVPGGTDKAGLPIYIGQAFVPSAGLLPACIYYGNTTAIASAALKIHYVDNYLKILCSGSPEKLQWIKTTKDQIDLITDCDLILGGVDYGSQENIGRVNYEGENRIGKVIRKPLGHDGLWVYGNGTERKFTRYEVLAYDCKSIPEFNLELRLDLDE